MEKQIEKIIVTLESLTGELRKTLISLRKKDIQNNSRENVAAEIVSDPHNEILELCKDIIRIDISNKEVIKSIVGKYSDGRLRDVAVEKLSELRSDIVTECNYNG